MVTPAKLALFRLLPSIDELLHSEPLQPILVRQGRAATLEAARAVLEGLRARIAANEMTEAQIAGAVDDVPREIEERLKTAMAYSLRPVINATGVILHTNLGRAPLSRAALDRIVEVSQGYCNLELDLETGKRGKRDIHVDRLLAKLLAGTRREVATILSLIHI